jgi:hypothetical protein
VRFFTQIGIRLELRVWTHIMAGKRSKLNCYQALALAKAKLIEALRHISCKPLTPIGTPGLLLYVKSLKDYLALLIAIPI